MKAILQSRSAKIGIAVLAALGMFAGGVAVASHNANHHTFSGRELVYTKVATDSAGFGSSANNVWQNVPGSTLSVGVPSGAPRLVNARFNAESSCSASNWCAMRIVARKSGTSTEVELYPRASAGFAAEFAFDSPGGEEWEGNSMHRSIRLGSSGTWYIYAQSYVAGSTGSVYLDDWHFEASIHAAS